MLNLKHTKNSNVILALPVSAGLVAGDIARLGTAGLLGLLHTNRATTALIAAGTAASGLADGEASVELIGVGSVVDLDITGAITQFDKVYRAVDGDGVATYVTDPAGNQFVGYVLETLSGAGTAKVALIPAALPTQKTVTFSMLANGSLADQAFYIAPRAQRVVRIDEVHSVAGNDAGAVNLQVTKDTGTSAPGAGTNLLTNNTDAGFDLKGTANTVQNGALAASAATLKLAAGDRLSVDFAGTLTTLAGVVVSVTLEDI